MVVSATVRTDQLEIAQDIGSHLAFALTRLDATLPGPLVDAPVRPDAGRATPPRGLRVGDLWQASPTTVHTDTADVDQSDPHASDRLAAALSHLQTTTTPGRPVVAVTGDPNMGVKLARFPDGDSVAFIVETTADLPAGAVEVTPANWVFDGETMRQAGQPARLRLSDQLPTSTPEAADDQIARMLNTGLEGLRDTLPNLDRPSRIHNLLDMQDLATALHPRDSESSQDEPPVVLPDPLDTSTTPGSGARGSFLVTVPPAAQFALGVRSALDGLERAGYQVVDIVDGWSRSEGPGMVVRVHPPGADTVDGPIQLRLLPGEGLDAYRQIVEAADRQKLPPEQVRQQLAQHPDLAAPEQVSGEPADTRPPVASAGAEQGLDPTPTTIAHGTVRMEDHPDFPALRQKLEDLGFPLVPVGKPTAPPHVEIRKVYDEDGNLLRTEREVQVHEGMRFLDLEHEADHVYQMTQRFPEGPPPTSVWQQRADGTLKELPHVAERMTTWQDAIIEYHVRLQEYIRLAERGVDSDVLREHLAGVDERRDIYWKKGVKKGRSLSQTAWAERHFPDIPTLEARVQELRAGPLMASADAYRGLDPTPTTIAHGTVRMEEHPDFPALRQELEDLGFRLVPVSNPSDAPHVEVRRILDEDGNLLRTEREVQVREGMRFLDLEHERDHVYQMVQRFDEPVPTTVWEQKANGRLKEISNSPARMKDWQDAIIEYHVRLQEYIRLAERGVDADTLREHLDGLDLHHNRYWFKGINRKYNINHQKWADKHFPDIPDLQRRAYELRTTPSRPDDSTPAGRHASSGDDDAGPLMAKAPNPSGTPPPPARRVTVAVPDKYPVSAHPTEVQQTVTDRLAGLPQTGHIPGLEAVRQLNNGRWELTYHGHPTEVEVVVRTDLPAGQARVTPARIELSANTPNGRRGDLVTGPLLTEAIHAHSGIVGSSTSAAGTSTSSTASQAQSQAPATPGGGSRPGGGPAQTAQGVHTPTGESTAAPGPVRVNVSMYGQATSLRVDAVRDVVQRLLPRLSSREVPRLEAVRPTPDPSVWTVTYGGIEAQVRITVSAELPAGRATLEPGSITLSGHAPDRMGDAITQAAVRQVLAEYGEHVRAGAVGSLAAQAVRAAGLSAADRLATEHPDLVSDGYRLRTATDPKHGELLIAEGPELPAAAFQFASRSLGDVVATTSPTGLVTPEGLPIYQITISEQIPEADRAATVPRVVAREVAEQLYQLRHSRRLHRWLDRLADAQQLAAQQSGDLAELRLELEHRAAATDPTTHDRRVGELLDRLAAEKRLDQAISQLEAAGQHADVALIRELLDPSARWRAEVAAERRAEVRAAVTEAAARLAEPSVAMITDAAVRGDLVRVTVADGSTVDVPIAASITALAGADVVGARLHARAAAELAFAVAEAAGDRLGHGWSSTPAVGTVEALIRLHDALPAGSRTEYVDELSARLKLLAADQIARVLPNLPTEPKKEAGQRIAEHVLWETVTALSGDGPTALARTVSRRSDDGWTLAGRFRERHVPAETVNKMTVWLGKRLESGASVHRARAEAAGVLGAELGAVSRARQPRLVGALRALAELWQDAALPVGTRMAVEALTGEVLSEHTLRPADWRALPPAAQDLVRQAPDAGLPDPFAPLRPHSQQELVQRIADEVKVVADQLKVGEFASASADAAEQAARMVARVLGEAEVGLRERSQARERYANEARARAEEHERGAQAEAQLPVKDRWADERKQALEHDAAVERANAERHARIGARYDQAREAAENAQRVYEELRAGLADLTSASESERDAALRRVKKLAGGALNAFNYYLKTVRSTQPVLLETGVPPERLPYLNALSAKVNALVAAQGVDTTVQPDELQRILRSGWGFVTSDEGLVFPLNFGDVEVRVAFKPGDAVEVLDPPQRAAEVIQAQLPQFPKGNRVLGATTKQHIKASHEHSLVGNILNWAGEAIPEDTSIPMVDVARETLRRAVLKLGFDHGRTTSFSGEGFGRFTVPGQVADNRGDSTYYSADGHFDVQIRRAGAHSRWTPVERVDAAIGDDSNFLKLAVEHVYTEPAPQATERLQSPPSDRTFPAHSLVRLSGLEDIRETVLDLLGRERDDAWQQVYTMVREEFPARLDHAIDHPHGFMRPIYSQGRPLALVQIKTEVVLSSAERIGTASNKVHLEQLRVSFAGYGGGVEWSRAHSKSGTAGVTMLPKKDNPLGELPDGSFTGQYSRDSSRREGIGVGGTAIRPNVQRYTGRTQAYRLELVHTVSVQRLDQPGSSPVSRSLSPSEAIVRLPELDAYRYGLPVDEAAVKRDSKGNKLYHPDGTAMLLDDLQDGPPPGRLKHPPRYLVGDEAIPGAGPALVQNLTGIEDLQKDLAAVLRERGYLPEQDRDGWVELPRSPMLASAQLANVLEFAELNGARVEGGYDQAAQDGLQLVFTKHRVGMAPKHLTLRLRITPDWKKADLIGHRFADTDVALDIISQRFVRKTGESSGQGFGPNADVSGGADGFGGVGPVEAGGAGFGGRGRSTHSSGTEYGDTVNHVKLIEGLANAYTATFRVPHTVKVVEVLADGSESKQPLVEGTGTADVRISADLLQPDQKSQDESVRTTGPTSERVLRRATLLHLNAKGIWERVRQVLPQGARPGAPSYDHLVGFVDSRSLLASPWWLYRDHGTEFAVDPRGEVQKRSSLWVRGKPRASEFLQAARLVVGDVNLTMSADTVTFSHSGAATGSASGKGGYEAPDTAGASAKTDGSRETSRTSTRIYGRERIAIENSVHYLYKMSVDIDVKGVEHRSAAAGGDRPSNRLLPSSVVYSVPERTALELYVDGELPVPQGQIMDVLRRYAEGKLDLNRRTVVRILAKLHSEHVATGKSKFLPGSILYAHGRLASKMVDRLIQAFPDVRVSPSGVIRRLQLLVDRGLTQPEAPASVAKVLRVAEPLKNALGQGGIEPGAVFTKPGAQTPVDLSDEVMRLIDQVVPEATTRTPGLRQGLIGQFAGEGWTGKLDRMLAEGFDMDFPVQNRLGTETVRLQINATLSNGEFIGDSPTTGSVAQDYAFAEHRVGRGYGRSSGGDLSGVGVPGARRRSLATWATVVARGPARRTRGSSGSAPSLAACSGWPET